MTATLTRSRPAPVSRHRWVALALAIVLCQAAGLIGVPFTSSGTDSWYEGLDLPPFNPPSWVFAPVWILLYTLIGIAAWRVWEQREHSERRRALLLFGVQLALNAAWSPLFFGAQRPGWALLDLVLLWLTAAATLILFARVDRPAAALFTPYQAWVSFALALNGAIVILN